MSGEVVTSTKPSATGTFGQKTVSCVFDGSNMVKAKGPDVLPGCDMYVCPSCGFVAFFARE